MMLLEEQERICLDRGFEDDLQKSYGNQALVLRKQGDGERALDLHQKQEGLCLKLGNTASLGYCYWNWGLVARIGKDPQTEQSKLNAALALFTDLGMPIERDAVAAELAQARGAGA